MLQTSGLSKGFGSRTLFEGVTWTVNAGDRVGLVGPNGAGKTTLLRIIAGQEHADSGNVLLGKDDSLGYLPQEVPREARGSVLEHVLSGRADLVDLKRAVEAAERALTAATDAAEASRRAEEHHTLFERLHHLDGHLLEARARDILSGLGFIGGDVDKSMSQLSGGWAMRAELARLLLARPSILLLDEPTNHLDIASLEWLERFLADYEGAWVVVSHDRYFLNRNVSCVAELTSDGVYVFPGDYDDYAEARAELNERLERIAEGRAQRVQELRAFVERFRAKASKARQAQSKLKALQRLEAEGENDDTPKRRQRSVRLQLPEPARSGDVVVRLAGASKRYGERVVYAGVDFSARRGERMALVGENGAGKSTLLKMLAGVLAPDDGRRELGHNVQTYYFAQHQTELLTRGRSVLDEMRLVMPDEPEARVRGVLGAFLFSGDAVDKTVEVLSGGEKSRLVLAKMLARPANFLLLDEPTNHLDLASRDVLEAALAGFAGTIVFISHDRYFINRVATKLVEIRSGGVLTEYLGDYDYYVWKRGAAQAAVNEAPVEAASAGVSVNAKAREERKAAQREANKRAKEATRLEQEILETEGRLREIDALLCDPTVYADAGRCKTLLAERETCQERLGPLYERWGTAAG